MHTHLMWKFLLFLSHAVWKSLVCKGNVWRSGLSIYALCLRKLPLIKCKQVVCLWTYTWSVQCSRPHRVTADFRCPHWVNVCFSASPWSWWTTTFPPFTREAIDLALPVSLAPIFLCGFVRSTFFIPGKFFLYFVGMFGLCGDRGVIYRTPTWATDVRSVLRSHFS